MAVRIRLQRHGRRKRPFYYIVVADSRVKRDGKFIERLGSYNPMTNPATIDLDGDKALDWLLKGAQPSDTVRAILSYKGIMLRKHLEVGVRKGALSEEEADRKFAEWLEEKSGKIQEKIAKLADAASAEEKTRLEREATVAKKRAEALKGEEAVEESTEEAATEEAVTEEAATEEPAPETEATETAEAPAEEAKEEQSESSDKEETTAKEEEAPAEEAKEEDKEEAEGKEEEKKD